MRENVVAAGIILVLAVVVGWEALQLGFGRDPSAAGFMPGLMAVSLIVLGIMLAFERGETPPGGASRPGLVESEAQADPRAARAVLGIVVGYVLLLPFLHFWVASVVALALLMTVLRAMSPPAAVLTSIVIVTIIHQLFAAVFRVSLP